MKNIFIKKTIAAALTSVALFGVLPVAASAATTATRTGWVQESGKWHFYNKDGVMLKNTTIDGYELGADGTWDMKGQARLEFKDGKCYYYDKDGVMQKNTTVTYGGRSYKLDETGAVNQGGALAPKEGKLDAEDIKDFTANVASTNGELMIDKAAKKAYFVDDSGKKVSGWVAYGHDWYYFDKTTGYEVEDATIDGHKIDKGMVVDKNLNLTTTENAHKNTDAYKATNKLWKKEGSNWCLYNELNEKSTGWQEDRGDWYFFGKDGIMQKNTTVKVGDKECKLGEDGAWCN